MRWGGVQRLAAAAMLLTAANSRAATAYVSDELVLNVYSDQNQQGQRLATLHSGASVETLATAAEYTQVRLSDGVTGWVKSSFLTTNLPATVRVKQLEEELDRNHATSPALAEAAARSELERLQTELSDTQARLAAALSGRAETPAAGAPAVAPALAPVHRSIGLGGSAIALLAGAVLGFWLGYATLARRIRRKFGGVKVY